MPEWLVGFLPWIVGGGSAGVGIVLFRMVGNWVGAAFVFFTGRADKREADIDAGMKALLELHKDEIATLKADNASIRGEVTIIREAHADCERRLLEVERTATKYEAMFQGFGDARNMIQRDMAAEKLEAREKDKK